MNRYDVSWRQTYRITASVYFKYRDHLGRIEQHLTARYLNHEGEIREGGRVNGSSSTGAHDEGDLRDDPRSQNIPLKVATRMSRTFLTRWTTTNVRLSKYQEYVSVAGQRLNAFLDPSSARIVQPDDWSADRHGLVHNLCTDSIKKHQARDKRCRQVQTPHLSVYLADLLCMSSWQTATKDCEVLQQRVTERWTRRRFCALLFTATVPDWTRTPACHWSCLGLSPRCHQGTLWKTANV